jgi:hypothetical protein
VNASFVGYILLSTAAYITLGWGLNYDSRLGPAIVVNDCGGRDLIPVGQKVEEER